MDFKNKKGTAMVEAALVFPIVILSVCGVIYMLIFFYETAETRAAMHTVLKAESGKTTHTAVSYTHLLPHNTYYTVAYLPAKFIEHEHHVFKYAGKRGEGIRVADAPEKLLPNSILTPGLAAGIFNAKYLNAVPLTRLGEDFARIDMNISRQTPANWMINISDRYLSHIYRRMHQVMICLLYTSRCV